MIAHTTSYEEIEVNRMQGNDQHTKYVFPEEAIGKKVFSENHLLPNASGKHDEIQKEGFNHY
jgi:hypothetical protein